MSSVHDNTIPMSPRVGDREQKEIGVLKGKPYIFAVYCQSLRKVNPITTMDYK